MNSDSTDSGEEDEWSIQQAPSWDYPPRTTESRLGRRQKTRDHSRRTRFLRSLRVAFDDADTSRDGKLSYEEWCSSGLGYIIRDGQMSQEEFNMYFKRIDANCDGFVSWGEFISYLMKDMTIVDLRDKHKAVQFIRKVTTEIPPKSHFHRNAVHQITISNRIGELITVSRDSIRFWNPSDMTLIRVITEPGLFSVILVFESYGVLGVTTVSRRLLLFDLDRFERLPAELAASPSPVQIKKMTKAEALSALKTIQSAEVPLFNVASAMQMANLTPVLGRYLCFFIGDDQGSIEILKLFDVERRNGTDFKLQKVMRYRMHQDQITQMSSLVSLDCYATSSRDATVKFWNWEDGVKPKVIVLRTFTDTMPITAFSFSNSQKVLATGGSTRDWYVWSITTSRKVFHMEQHYNQLSGMADFVTTTNERYVLTLTTKNEFRLSDPVNYRKIREWTDSGALPYKSLFFDEMRHTLITSTYFPVKWAEDVSALANSLQPVSHVHPIVGCQLAAFSNELVTVDTVGGIRVWNVNAGTLSSFYNEPWQENLSEITTMTLDISGRRLITSNFQNEVKLWNYNNGTVMANLDLSPLRSLITILRFFTILGRSILVSAGWDHMICMYQESEPEQFKLYRQYSVHTDDISAVASYHNGIVSGSVSGEIVVWVLDSALPQFQRVIQHGNAVEALECFETYVFVADSVGFIRIFTIQKLFPILVMSGHRLSVRHSISAIAIDKDHGILYTGDTFGYVKKWDIVEEGEHIDLKGQGFARCHPEEVTNLLVVNGGADLATIGADKCIRLWDSHKLDYIGLFTETNRWEIDDRTTWAKECPFAPDPNHFENPMALKSMKSVIHVNFRDLLDRPQNEYRIDIRPSFTLQTIDIDATKLSLFEMRQLIDEFTHDNNTEKPPEEALLKIVKKDLIHPPRPLLQMSHRPQELIEEISEIYRKEEGFEPPPPAKKVLLIPTPNNVRRPRRTGRSNIFIG